MKALTVKQPWAWAIVSGGKWVENRTWPTAHRGPLVIHAGSSRADLGSIPEAPDDLDFGKLIGVVEVIDCRRVSDVNRDRWVEGPWCWVLANPRLIRPVAFRGQMGLFTVPDGLIVLK